MKRKHIYMFPFMGELYGSFIKSLFHPVEQLFEPLSLGRVELGIFHLQDDATRDPALYCIGRLHLQDGVLEGVADIADCSLQDLQVLGDCSFKVPQSFSGGGPQT